MSVEDHQGNLWDTIPPPGLGTPLGRLRSRRSKRYPGLDLNPAEALFRSDP